MTRSIRGSRHGRVSGCLFSARMFNLALIRSDKIRLRGRGSKRLLIRPAVIDPPLTLGPCKQCPSVMLHGGFGETLWTGEDNTPGPTWEVVLRQSTSTVRAWGSREDYFFEAMCRMRWARQKILGFASGRMAGEIIGVNEGARGRRRQTVCPVRFVERNSRSCRMHESVPSLAM